MAAIGVLGDGVRVFYSLLESPIMWVEVESLMEVVPPQIAADVVNKDVHRSSGFHRQMRGLKAVSPLTLKLLADLKSSRTPTHAALRDLQSAGTTILWRVEIPLDRDPDVTQYQAQHFLAYVSDFKPNTPIADKQTIDVMAQFDGDYIDTNEPTDSVGV